jgi:hypothetical protein
MIWGARRVPGAYAAAPDVARHVDDLLFRTQGRESRHDDLRSRFVVPRPDPRPGNRAPEGRARDHQRREADPAERFRRRYADALVEIGVGGANPNPIFTGMMAANQLREIGLRPESGGVDAPWSRPSLDNPAVVAAMPTAAD